MFAMRLLQRGCGSHILTEINIEWLRQQGTHFVAGVPGGFLSTFSGYHSNPLPLPDPLLCYICQCVFSSLPDLPRATHRYYPRHLWQVYHWLAPSGLRNAQTWGMAWALSIFKKMKAGFLKCCPLENYCSVWALSQRSKTNFRMLN